MRIPIDCGQASRKLQFLRMLYGEYPRPQTTFCRWGFPILLSNPAINFSANLLLLFNQLSFCNDLLIHKETLSKFHI